ncbi:inositol-tetrakisphosphate 1-kinase [Anaeramoeba ignava]|uniref:Inositol-tetrakisphosphate 1-kinase n=1 Tax=Anaeramoeba ignava TaxID=1746090 RepID=A0A9Q0LEP0_ANAIG|nr:inositol-tetrakisphosphate 1-kinase [Anaeramoeba ignava]
MRKIGFILQKSKQKKLDWDKFIEYCKVNRNMEFEEIDLNKEITGKYDLIIHKITNEYANAMNGNKEEKEKIENLTNYLKKNPNVPIIEPLEKLQKLSSREETWNILRTKLTEIEPKIKIANHMKANSKEEAEKLMEENKEINYPIFCKPIQASGAGPIHILSIVGNKEGFKEVNNFPVLIEPYINHNETVSNVVCSHLDVFLIGYDLIKDSENGIFYLIDVNYFPRSSSVDSFFEELADLIETRMKNFK